MAKELPKTRVTMQDDKNTKKDSSFSEMEKADKKGSLFGKLNARFQDAIQEGRSDESLRDGRQEPSANARPVSADDLAIRRSKSVNNPQRMMIPEGVIIDGSLSSSSETDVGGKIDGDVTVESNLNLMPSALITGRVRAINCVIHGFSEGQVECDQNLELGKNGKITSNIMAGNSVVIAGEVKGNIKCGGRVHLTATALVNGNIRGRSVVIDPGAMFNGTCSMGTPKS